MNESDTPRTDEAIRLCGNFIQFPPLESFARTLERELDQWKAVAGELAKVATCVCFDSRERRNECNGCKALDKFNDLTK